MSEREELSPAIQALYAGRRDDAEALLPDDSQLSVFEAAAFGRAGRVREVLAADPESVNAFSPDGFTPLHLACFSGGADVARELLEQGADPEAVARSSFAPVRPLGTAAFSGDVAAARVLLDHGADPNAGGAGGSTPLHSAAQNGNDELVELLLARGAQAGTRLPDGRTPADLARAAGHERTAALLE